MPAVQGKGLQAVQPPLSRGVTSCRPQLLAWGAEADVGIPPSWGPLKTIAEPPKYRTEATRESFGFSVLTSSHGVSHPPPFWGWAWGDICPLVGAAFSASLLS